MSDIQPQAGKHDYAGACDPAGKILPTFRYETFSVGVFRWRQKAAGRGLKKGPTLVRVVGSMGQPELVYAKALEIVRLLDAGEYRGPKRVQVRGAAVSS